MSIQPTKALRDIDHGIKVQGRRAGCLLIILLLIAFWGFIALAVFWNR